MCPQKTNQCYAHETLMWALAVRALAYSLTFSCLCSAQTDTGNKHCQTLLTDFAASDRTSSMAAIEAGNCQLQIGRSADALRTFEELLSRTPQFMPALVGKARSLNELTRPQEALSTAVHV